MVHQTPLLKKAIIRAPHLTETSLICTYEIDGEILTNVYELPKGMRPDRLGTAQAEKLSQWMAIASCFGLFSLGYLDEITCQFPLTTHDVAFFEKLFYLGFGEFKLVNNIPLKTRTTLLSTTPTKDSPRHKKPSPHQHIPGRALLLNGGGKDGSVSAALLSQNSIDFTWFQRGDSVAQQQVVQSWSKPLLKVRRILDPKRKERVYSGHRPMSAGIAFLAMLCAYLYDYRYVIASNESSANEGNVTIDGFTVNHQYSKSLEFEADFQALFLATGITEVYYFSLLRPLNELQIASFTTKLTGAQLSAIVSCNNGTSTGTWCLKCPKCAFITLVVYAVSPTIARSIWGDINVINTPSLTPFITELIDPNQEKPLECVGTLDECHVAANLIIHNHAHRPFLNNATLTLIKQFIPHNTPARIPDTISKHHIPPSLNGVIAYMKRHLKTAQA